MSFQRVLFIALGAIFVLSGCSSATLNAGAALSKVGQAAAIQMEQNATVSAATLVTLRKAVAFNDGYNGVVGNPDSQTFISNTTEIESKLSLYAKMLESLSSSYAALGDLAAYDAIGTFSSSMGTLAKDSNQFLKSVGSSVQISPTATSLVQAGGGIMISIVQAHEVKDASREIKAILQTIIPELEKPDVRNYLVSSKDEVTRQIYDAAIILVANGVYSYDPLLDDLGAAFNLKSNSSSDGIVGKNTQLQTGLRNVAIEIAQEQASALTASYDKSVAALKALVPLHDSLENGAPLNLDTLVAITSELNTIASSLKPPRGK